MACDQRPYQAWADPMSPVGRMVAGVLLATGRCTPQELARANEALSALSRPPLGEDDFVADTPEALAPQIPDPVREPLLRLAFELRHFVSARGAGARARLRRRKPCPALMDDVRRR